jgi:hypothetical protein
MTDDMTILQLKMNRAEKMAFTRMCSTIDTTASREVRMFIRAFMSKHAGKTADMFAQEEDQKPNP